MSYNLSPDVDDLLAAISIVKGGASIVPDDIDAAVQHVISELGPEAIRYCARMSEQYKRGFLIGWAERLRSNKPIGNNIDPSNMGVDATFMTAGKHIDFKRGFYIGFCNAPVKS